MPIIQPQFLLFIIAIITTNQSVSASYTALPVTTIPSPISIFALLSSLRGSELIDEAVMPGRCFGKGSSCGIEVRYGPIRNLGPLGGSRPQHCQSPIDEDLMGRRHMLDDVLG